VNENNYGVEQAFMPAVLPSKRWASAPEVKTRETQQFRESRLAHTSHLQKSPLNNLQPPLNFIRFFKTLRFFVASTFVARL